MYDHDCDICDHHMWCDVIFIAKSQEINKKTKLQKKREIIKNRKQLSSLRRFLTFQVSKLGYKVSVVATTRHSRTNDLTTSKALSRAIK